MIKLFKNKIIYENDINLKHKDYIKEEVDSVIPYLNNIIELAKNFTLEDFFKIIEKDVDIYELLFSSHLGHHPLKPFVDDCFKDIQSKNDDMNIEFLECRWGAELADWGSGKEFEIYVDFHGWGSWYAEHLKERETGGIAVEFTPIYELKNISLKLNENFILCDGKTFKTIRKGNFEIFITSHSLFGMEISYIISLRRPPLSASFSWSTPYPTPRNRSRDGSSVPQKTPAVDAAKVL